MSWLSGIAGKAENILNSLDQSASEALNTEARTPSRQEPPDEPSAVSPAQFMQPGGVPRSASGLFTSTGASHRSTPTGRTTPNFEPAPKRKDRDEELLDFLNSGAPVPQAKSAGHSRGSSISRPASEYNLETGSSVDEGLGSVSAVSGNDGVSLPSEATSSSEPPAPASASSVELENKLLRSELLSLNQEVSSLLKRNHKSEEESKRLRGKIDQVTDLNRMAERDLREMRSTVADLTETLQVKESQLLAMRQEYDMVCNYNASIKSQLEAARVENNTIREDHSSSSGVNSQALEDLRHRLQASEAAVEQERAGLLSVQAENDRLRRMLEEAKVREAELEQQRSRSGSDERRRLELLTGQHEVLRMKHDAIEKELRDYKEKASKILAMKEKVIAGLKSGEEVGQQVASVSAAEHAALRHEADLLREEVQRQKLEVERRQLELQEVEYAAQSDADALRKSIELLEAENAREKQVRLDAQEELSQLRREHQFLQEKNVKEKTSFAERLADKESELDRLRGMLRVKAHQSDTTEELESRVRALTEQLILKQTNADACNAERHSLQVKLERLQTELTSLERSHIALRANMGSELAAGPGTGNGGDFVRINMQDAPLTRRVKGAVNSVDAFGIRLGVFLRRYPVARIFFIAYCALLHLWVFFVLLTYQPEMHAHGLVPAGLAPLAPQEGHEARPGLPRGP